MFQSLGGPPPPMRSCLAWRSRFILDPRMFLSLADHIYINEVLPSMDLFLVGGCFCHSVQGPFPWMRSCLAWTSSLFLIQECFSYLTITFTQMRCCLAWTSRFLDYSWFEDVFVFLFPLMRSCLAWTSILFLIRECFYHLRVTFHLWGVAALIGNFLILFTVGECHLVVVLKLWGAVLHGMRSRFILDQRMFLWIKKHLLPTRTRGVATWIHNYLIYVIVGEC